MTARLSHGVFSEFTVDQKDNLTPVKHEITLRKRLTHNRETPSEILIDDLQQRISKLRVQNAMLVAVAHRRRIETRVLGFDGEDECTCPFRFLARQNGGRPDGTLSRLECDSIRVLRHAHLCVRDQVDAALLLLLDFDFELVRRRQVVIAAVTRCRWRRRGRIAHVRMLIRIVNRSRVPLV